MTPDDKAPETLAQEGWEVRMQITYVSPAKPTPDMPGIEMRPAPRTNLVVNTTPLQPPGQTLQAVVEDFLKQTAGVVPDLEVLEPPQPFEFADHVPGMQTVIRFQAMPTLRLRLQQHHYFRIDASEITQIVLTHDAEVDDEYIGRAREAARCTAAPRDRAMAHAGVPTAA
jgi:hypothetical protein